MGFDYWQTFSEGTYFHVYNRTIGKDLLFLNNGHYTFFLKKYQLYIGKYVDTAAFCLMSNHFHFIIRPKIVDKTFLELAQQENSIVARQFVYCAQVSDALQVNTQMSDAVQVSTQVSDAVQVNAQVSDAVQVNAQVSDAVQVNAQVSDASKASDTFVSYDDFLVDQFKRFFNSYSAAFNKQQNRTGSLFQRKFKRVQLKSVPRLLNRICYVHHNPIHHDASPFYESWQYSSFKIYLSKNATQLARDLGLSLFAPISGAPKTSEVYYSEAIASFLRYHKEFHDEWVKNQRLLDADDMEGI